MDCHDALSVLCLAPHLHTYALTVIQRERHDLTMCHGPRLKHDQGELGNEIGRAFYLVSAMLVRHMPVRTTISLVCSSG